MTVQLVQDVPQPFGAFFVRVDQNRLEIHGQTVPENRLDKHTKCLHMHPSAEALTEIDLQPTNEWTLKTHTEKQTPKIKRPKKKVEMSRVTYKLFLLIGNQFGDLIFAGR